MKLRHTSQKAYLALMQMSETQLFIFVEGKQADRPFYSKIAEAPCSSAGISAQVATASEIPEASGGKESLGIFHDFLNDQRSLVFEFKGKKKAALFFADKDIDDLLNQRIRSQSFIYTKTYDVEGTILKAGDVFGAAATMAGLAQSEVRESIKSKEEWLRACAEKWKQWLAICIYCKKHKLTGLPNFRVSSQVNRETVGEVDKDRLDAYIAKMKATSGYSDVKFRRSFSAVSRTIERLYRENRHYEVFKGKWYLLFLSAEIRRIARGRAVDLRALHYGLIGGVQMTLAHPNALTEHFVASIQTVLALLI